MSLLIGHPVHSVRASPTTAFPAIAALALGLSLTLTACGADDIDDTSKSTSSEVSTSEHNDADVEFATGMIPHHTQALDMVDLTEGRDLDSEVEALADDIRAAQAPEVERMTGWLSEWNEPIPDPDAGGHEGHDMGGDTGSEMPGMMTAEDMAALEDASDAEFQDMWLEMMIEHHQGAVEMAEVEEAGGQYQPAVDLANVIQESQTAEIEKMQGLLS